MERGTTRIAGIAENRGARVFGKRSLQVAVAVLAGIPVLVGTLGVVEGPAFLKTIPPRPLALESHFRFLCGIFVAVGLAWWSTIPVIERKGERFRLLALLIVAGGRARLVSLFVAGWPPAGHVAGLAPELAVVPLLVWWQTVVARGARDGTFPSGAIVVVDFPHAG